MSGVDWRIVAIGAGALLLGLERLWRLRRVRSGIPTLTQKALVVALFCLGLLCVTYGTVSVTSSFYNIGLAFWHADTGVLLGAVEVLVLTLRVEQVTRKAVRRIMIRSAVVTAVLIATWLPGFAFVEPVQDLGYIERPWSPALILHLIVFHGYVIWTLTQLIILSCLRVPRDLRRRPIKGVALLMVGVGAAGFVWMNATMAYYLATDGPHEGLRDVIAPNVIFLGLFVLGGFTLGFGERLHDEIHARLRLRRLRHLWNRVVDLSPYSLGLASHLPAPIQLQRAYVEILDGLSILRVHTDAELTVHQAADILRRGAVTNDPTARTISQSVSSRTTRQDDIAFIHDMAKAYTDSTRDSGAALSRVTSPLSERAANRSAVSPH